MSKFNTELAEDVLRNIFAAPTEHHQKKWIKVPSSPSKGYTIDAGTLASGHACGSQACIAGWAALLSGWQIDVVVNPRYAQGRSITVTSPEGEVETGKSEVEFKEEGRVALGLTGNEAGCLFYTMNERFAVARLYSKIKTGDLDALLKETEEELQVRGYTPMDGNPTYVYSSTVIDELYRQAQSEYSPALDILNTLAEPVLESADQ